MNPKLSRSYPIEVVERAVRFPPRARRLLLIGIDALLLPLAVWLSFWLRLAQPLHPSFQAVGLWLLPAVLLIGLPLYVLIGQYKGLTRYVGSRALYRLAGRNGLLVLLFAGLGMMLSLPIPPRSSWILLWLVHFHGLAAGRRIRQIKFEHHLTAATACDAHFDALGHRGHQRLA